MSDSIVFFVFFTNLCVLSVALQPQNKEIRHFIDTSDDNHQELPWKQLKEGSPLLTPTRQPALHLRVCRDATMTLSEWSVSGLGNKPSRRATIRCLKTVLSRVCVCVCMCVCLILLYEGRCCLVYSSVAAHWWVEKQGSNQIKHLDCSETTQRQRLPTATSLVLPPSSCSV